MHQLVPRFILDNYRRNNWRGQFFAACLFTDVSGFTTITDSLMQHGPHGAETLAGLMRNVFDPLIHGVYEYDGFVATLAGDAFTAIFPATSESEAGKRDAAVRAMAAAWQIQRRMEQVTVQNTSYGEFKVSAKVGAACGEVNWGIVSSDDKRRSAYYFEGPAIDGSAQAEHSATAGEILMTASLLDLVGQSATVEALAEGGRGLHRLLAVGDDLPLGGPVMAPDLDGDVMSRFFPAEIVNQQHSGEFRQILSLFINLPTVRTEDQLTIFMRLLFTLQGKYGGLLNRVDFGDKGSNALLFWGVPVTYENDVARALNFILDLQTNTSIPINAGVTSRIAHAGFVGSQLREEYTCYGRGVNLAARFMTAAPRGEIWLDEHTARLADRHYDIEYEGKKAFKGFADEQRVYVLFEAIEDKETFYDGPMFGRQKELQALADSVKPLWKGKPAGTIIIWGEPGMGKSRLAHEFHKSDLIAEADVLWTLCQSDEILRESFNPFRYWLRSYFNQSESQSEPRNKRNFNRKVDGLIAETAAEAARQPLAAELDRTRSFLGAVLGLHWPDSLYAGLDAPGRYENTLLALLALLKAESLRQPLIVQLEDMHLIDEASLELLVRLSEALKAADDESYPIAIIATSRREGPGCPLPESELCLEIDLEQLPRESLRDLAAGILGGAISEPLLELIAARAEGNPFFAEQIVRYLQESDLLLEGENGWQEKKEQRSLLPDDVRSVLSARLDRLAQEVKDVVQTAAVLGREFEVMLLVHMLRDETLARERIAAAEEAAIWSALSQMRYLFKHSLLRDTAYHMQVRSRRAALHQLAVEALETLYAEDPRPHYGELAYHSQHAGLEIAAADWYFLAAHQSLIRGTFFDALNYFDQAEAILPESETERRWWLLLQQVSILGMQGETESAKEKVTLALELGQDLGDDTKIAEAHLGLANLANMMGDDQTALIEMEAGLAASKRSGSTRYEALILGLKTTTLARMGRIDDAAIVAEGALVLAEELGDDQVLVRILTNLANFYMSTGDYGRAADLLSRQIEINRRRNNQVGVGYGLTNLSYNQLSLGQYEDAQEAIAQALQLTMAMGAKRLSAYNRLNLGLALVRLRRPASARPEIEAARQALEEVDDKFGVAASHSYMGMALESDGQPELAVASFEKAATMMQEIGAAGYVVDAKAGHSRCLLLRGDNTPAGQLANEVWDYLKQSGPDGLEFPLLAYDSCGRVLEATGNEDALRAIVEAGYQHLMERAQKISDAGWRDSYLNNVPEHSALIQRWQKAIGP